MTQGDIVMTEDQEGTAKDLNNDKPEINKCVELLLRNRRNKPPPSKTFQIKFSFFNREITLYLDIKKSNPGGR